MEDNRTFAVGLLCNNGPLEKHSASNGKTSLLATTLNAVGLGATKNGLKWRDMQSKESIRDEVLGGRQAKKVASETSDNEKSADDEKQSESEETNAEPKAVRREKQEEQGAAEQAASAAVQGPTAKPKDGLNTAKLVPDAETSGESESEETDDAETSGESESEETDDAETSGESESEETDGLNTAKLVPDAETTGESESEEANAEPKAERREKQEEQGAAEQAASSAVQGPSAKPKDGLNTAKLVPDAETSGEAMSPKPKEVIEENQYLDCWFGLEYKDNVEKLRNMPVNTHIHPAFIKLGVQLSTRRVSGANARCVAILDALKKMTKDYVLPANTEFSRELDAHVTESVDFLATLRQSTTSEINAVKFYRHHLKKLPNNVKEHEAKKTLQDEIDRYIHEQVIVAGEAISADIRKKISPDDVILTYGFSSLVERCLVDAHSAGIPFRCVVCGCRGADSERGARELTRRLCGRGLTVALVDITALGAIMRTVSKVVTGASAVLSTGSVLGSVGTALVALQARRRNVPVLIVCETHKFSEQVYTDAFGHNELGDPDNLNAVGNDNWALKDWRSMPSLAILNLGYDLTPPCHVTAVFTELAVVPCTSAPVVLRFRANAYGI